MRDVPAPSRRGRWREEQPEEPGEPLFWDDLSGEERSSFLQEFVAVPGTARGEAGTLGDPPVELHLELRSVADTAAEAIAVGLFSNVEPAGAATALDAQLGGVIADLSRRRAIAAASAASHTIARGSHRRTIIAAPPRVAARAGSRW